MRQIAKSLLTACLIFLLFCGGILIISDWMATEGRRALQHELELAVQHCYAVEGRYPPSLRYLERHYGIRTANRRYQVEYRSISDGHAPEIRVKRVEGGAWA